MQPQKKPATQTIGGVVIVRRNTPSENYIMQDGKYIIGLSQSKHADFAAIVEQLATEIKNGTINNKEDAKRRREELMHEADCLE